MPKRNRLTGQYVSPHTTPTLGGVKLDDTDASNTVEIYWNEDDSSDRTFAIKVNSGNRTIDLSENFTIGDGYNVTITAEDANAAITLDNMNIEIEDTVGSGGTYKVVNGTGGNIQLTVEGVSSVIDQDVTQDNQPTFAGVILTADIDTDADAIDWDLLDDDSSALSFDAAGKAGMLNFDTTNGSEKLDISCDVVIAEDLTVNGTTTTISTTELLVEDKLITLNDGGAAASGGGSGFEIEEDGSATGYVKTSSDRNKFEFKVPNNAGILTLDIDATKTWTANGALNVQGDSAINQDVQDTASPTFVGLTLTSDIDWTGGASDIDLIDDNASALSFDTDGKAGLLEFVTTNGSEGVNMSGFLSVTGALTADSVALKDSDDSNTLQLFWDEDDSSDRTLGFKVNSGNRTIDLAANIDIDGTLTVSNAFTVGATNGGSLDFSAASKTLTVEDNVTVGLDINALEGLSGSGLVTRTAANTYTERTITGTTNEITVTNGNGVSGDPTISLPDAVYLGTSGAIGRDANNYLDVSSDGIMVFNLNGTGGAAYLQIKDSDGAGHLAVGDTGASERSVLSIVDGGTDKPGVLQFYTDAGSGMYNWVDTSNVLRVKNGDWAADPDSEGYQLIDYDTGLIGDTAQDFEGNDIALSGAMTLEATKAAQADEISLIKQTYQAGDTYTGTQTPLTIKAYDADATVVHDGNEFAGLAVFVKQHAAMTSGGKSSLATFHMHSGSTVGTDFGLRIFGDQNEAGIQLTGGTSATGLDLSNQTITSEDIKLSNGDTIFNSSAGVIEFGTDPTIYLGAGKIGRDADNLIDFSTDQITFRTSGSDGVYIASDGDLNMANKNIDSVNMLTGTVARIQRVYVYDQASGDQNYCYVYVNNSNGTMLNFVNTSTGTGLQGTGFGINSSEQGLIWNYENTDILIATNNNQIATFTTAGALNIDAINEYTTDNGVEIEGIYLEDNVITLGAGKVGRDADNLIDFSTDNQILFRCGGSNGAYMQTNASSLYGLTNVGTSENTKTRYGSGRIDWYPTSGTCIMRLSDANGLQIDKIGECTTDNGIQVEGTLIKDSTFDTNVAAAKIQIAGTGITTTGTDANVPLIITLKGTGGSAYAQIKDTNGAGHLAVGDTSASERSILSIVDGGTDKPGVLQLYNDSGSGMYQWMDTNNVLRVKNADWTDPDSEGYQLIDFDNGTIGATGQDIYGQDIYLDTGHGVIVNSIQVVTDQQAHIADPAACAAVTAATLTDNSGGGATDNTIDAIDCEITDPADTPASADALRDDLVTNTIPDIEGSLQNVADAIAELANQVNALKADADNQKSAIDANNSAIDSILAALETHGLLANA